MISRLFRWIGFVAVCLVVTIHLPASPSKIQVFLHDRVSLWAVPWFFFASGFWTAGRAPSWRRIRSLLIPYLLANGLWFAIMAMIQAVGTRYLGMEPSRFGLSVTDILAGFGVTALLPALVPTWFLRALLVFVFMAPLVGTVARRSVVGGGFIVVLAFAGHFYLESLDLPASLHGFLTFAFPTFGFACYALGTVVGVVADAPRLAVKDAKGLLTRNVFAVYLLHVPILLLFSYALRPFAAWDWTKSDFGFFVLWPSLVVLSLGAAEILRRLCPRFARLFLGGR